MGHHHYSARRHPEFVVLEIGDGIGALIIHAAPEMHGIEIEISPAGEDSQSQPQGGSRAQHGRRSGIHRRLRRTLGRCVHPVGRG